MPRILKYNYVNVDTKKVEIEPPVIDFSVSLEEFESHISNDEFEGFDETKTAETADIAEETAMDPVLNASDIVEIAKMQAEEIIAEALVDAQMKAQNIETEARENAENEAKALYEKVEEKAYKDGYEKAMADVAVLKEEAAQELEAAKYEREHVLDELEPQIVDLTVSIINKILNDVKAINPQIIFNLVKRGLSETKIMGEIFIRVSENEYDMVMENKDKLLGYNDPNVKIEVVKDYSLESGGCVLETSFGNVDCSIDEQFKKVKESLYFILDSKK